MADNQENISSGTGSTGTTAAAETTASIPKIRLAHDPKIVRAKTIEEGGGFERVYFTPPTAKGEVNIYGFGAIYLPSKTDQKEGFTPLRVAKKEVVKTKGGEEVQYWFDKDSGIEATRVLLEQYPGIYKPVTAKGE